MVNVLKEKSGVTRFHNLAGENESESLQRKFIF